MIVGRCGTGLVAALGMVVASVVAGAADVTVPWGTIESAGAELGRHVFRVKDLPADGSLVVPAGFPQIVRATLIEPDGASAAAGGPVDVPIEISPDASRIALVVPSREATAVAPVIAVETADVTTQFPDGRIVFAAPDATVVGDRAKLETHPGNARIGYWSNPADRVEWNRTATRWGAYEAVLTYSTASRDGTEIEVEVAGVKLPATLPSTGSWYRYRTLPLGRVVLPAAGPQPVVVRCTKSVGGAVMNLKAVSLLPACEGTPPTQAEDGTILLHGRDATVLGTTLRWEPAEKKQTLGFWTRATDRARWTFTVRQPGSFDVEVLQGCGTGQGGSTMTITCDGDRAEPPPGIVFTVEETGHFQNFQPRVVGRVDLAPAGTHTLVVGPEKIAKGAACDIRQIRLVPVQR